MKRILKKLAVFALLAAMTAANGIVLAEQGDINFYVSTEGDDKNPGTLELPFKTLEKARDSVRKINKNADTDINVNIMGGTYFLDETFKLTPEDSGTNGHNVVYRNYNNEKPIISAGIKIDGWQQHDGNIWKLKLDDATSKKIGKNYISNIYFGDKVAKMARLDDYTVAKSVKRDVGSTEKFVFDKEDLKYDSNRLDMFMTWGWNWRCYFFPMSRTEQDANGDTVFYSDAEEVYRGINTMYVPKKYAFLLINAYDFMDTPGEFYYNRNEKTLYYYKDDAEDLSKTETIIPYLEEVWRIDGTDSINSVSNIKIEGLTFSHSMSQRSYKYGIHNNQGLNGLQVSTDENYATEVDFSFTNRGAMGINYANNLTIVNNAFMQLDNIGLALYNNVTDSVIEGNVFADISDAAFTAGRPGQGSEDEIPEGLTNISVQKPVTASGESGNSRYNAVDGNDSTKWVGDSDNGKYYIQVDLEDKYKIAYVDITVDTSAGSGHVFEVQASNTPSFSEYEVLARQTLSTSEFLNNEGIFRKKIGDPKKYRYIRVAKNNQGSFAIWNLKVFTDTLDGASRGERCRKIDFKNNYITRTCREFWSSPAIMVFWVDNFNILHNEINGAPYTGISLGWGWACPQESFGNIKINYNKMNNTNSRMHDGAAIYVLAKHPNSEMVGNHIKDTVHGMGGIYPDNGSFYWSIRENIIENVPVSFHPWAADEGNMVLKDNYTSSPYYVIGAANTTMENTELFVRDHMPAHIKEKAELAGLESKWDYIRDKVCDGNTPDYTPKLTEEGYPSNDTFAPLYYWDGGYSHVKSAMTECNNLLKIARASKLNVGEYEKVCDDFENVLFDSQDKDAAGTLKNIDEYYNELRRLYKARDEFVNSGIFTNDNYKVQILSYGVKTNTGSDEVINSDTPISLNTVIDDFDSMVIPAAVNMFKTRDKSSVYLSATGINTSHYGGAKFGDALFDGDVTMEYKPGDFQGFVFRANNTGMAPGDAEYDCYIMDFTEGGIEIQRFNKGKRTVFYGNVAGSKALIADNLPYAGWDRTKKSNIQFGATNVENGVRIRLIIDGNTYCDFVDTDKDALREPGYLGMLSPAGKMTIYKK